MKSKILLLAALAVLSGCNTVAPYDYTSFNQSKPRSILVLPPVNHSIEVAAPYTYLATVTQPLAERGYYVLPVGVIDLFLKENGLPTPEEMNQVPLDKLREYTGADAVLYGTINRWGQKYSLISSNTVVDVDLKLVDARSGQHIWDADINYAQGAGDGGGGLAGMVIAAVVNQVMSSIVDKTYRASNFALTQAMNDPQRGLPAGPYGPM